MDEFCRAVGWAFLVLSFVGAVYAFFSGLALSWFLKRAAPVASTFPAITILKPLHGDEPGLRQALDGFCTQDYPGPVQIIFGVRDPLDPAISAVRSLMHDHPNVDIELVIDSRVWGSNLKISNLINMEAKVRHPLLVLADSDVSVAPDYLRQLAGGLSDPRIGYVTCAYVGVATGNLWSRLSAMAINHHFLPSVALGMRLKMADACFGPTVAFQREVFDRSGGFARLKDLLADDFEIGQAIRALGLDFAVTPMLIGHGCSESTPRSLIKHELRWARTIRLVAPLSYAGTVVCHPLPFVLLGALFTQGAAECWPVLLLVVMSRLFVMAEVSRLTRADFGAWWMWPVREFLSATVFVGAFTGATVEWRGRPFTLSKGGALVPQTTRRAPSPVLLSDPFADIASDAPIA